MVAGEEDRGPREKERHGPTAIGWRCRRCRCCRCRFSIRAWQQPPSPGKPFLAERTGVAARGAGEGKQEEEVGGEAKLCGRARGDRWGTSGTDNAAASSNNDNIIRGDHRLQGGRRTARVHNA